MIKLITKNKIVLKKMVKLGNWSNDIRPIDIAKREQSKLGIIMMMNCFCGVVDRRKVFSLISSRYHCQRSSPSRISDTPQAGFELAQNLSSDFYEWSCTSTSITKKQSKLKPKFNQHPYVVTDIKGTKITAENPVNNHQVTRNISQFIKVPPNARPPRPMKEIFDEEEDDSIIHKIGCSSPNTTLLLDNSVKRMDIHKRKSCLKQTRRPISEWKMY